MLRHQTLEAHSTSSFQMMSKNVVTKHEENMNTAAQVCFPLSCRLVERPNHVQSNPSRPAACIPQVYKHKKTPSITLMCLKKHDKIENAKFLQVSSVFQFDDLSLHYVYICLDEKSNAPGFFLALPQYPGMLTSIDRLGKPP